MNAAPRPSEPIIHVDMDAFYASVESLKAPSLKGRPIAVGGAGARGVVASASYEARRYGVRSAMPMAQARRLCPPLLVVAPDFAAYQEASARLMTLLRSVTPLVEPLSLDEAFLDVGGSARLLGPPSEIGAGLRERIRAELGLPASVGIAANKFLAKLCSAKAKPDGLLHLRAGQEQTFLAPLDVRDLWGVGERTAQRLAQAGIQTVGDLRAAPQASLRRLAGPSAAEHLAQLARGVDSRGVTPHAPAKGMSAEETFDRDVTDHRALRTELLRLADRLAPRLRRAHVCARSVTLKVRRADFSTMTRSRTLETPTDQATQLHEVAVQLLGALGIEGEPVRLVGIAAGGLVPAATAQQLRLGEDGRWRSIEQTADRARDRFGDAALRRGALLGEGAARSGDAAPSADQWRSAVDEQD